MRFKWKVLMLIFLPFPALAATEFPARQIQLSVVDQPYQVTNTVMSAMLQATASGKNTAELADAVNKKTHWALQQVHAVQGVQIQSNEYQTQPDYTDGKRSGWTVKQNLQITATNLTDFDRVLGKLQSRLELVSLKSEPALAARDAAEQVASHQAIARFRKRAMAACGDFGYADMRLNTVQILAKRASTVPGVMMAATARSPVESAPGESALSVEVSGSVQCVSATRK